MMSGILDQKDMSGCAISGMLSETGRRFGCDAIVRSIANMHERSNGLGGGFAAYGIYPEFEDHYVIHLMCDHAQGKKDAEAVLASRCAVHNDEPIPVRPTDAMPHWPILHRYFVTPREDKQQRQYRMTDDDGVLPIGGLQRAHVDCARSVSHEHDGVVGRRSPVRPS
jgi:glutamate synthase domain-containing protein 1